ncbi:CAP domain-containing protein [Chloroflexota bacterium]
MAMSKGQLRWVVVLLCLALASLTAVGRVRAQKNGEPSHRGYALGVQAPDADVGEVTLADGMVPSTVQTAVPADAFVDQVVRLINLERQNGGLPPYQVNPILGAIAQGHSAYMRDQDCFAHQCPGEVPTSARACGAGYQPYGWGDCYVGETLAAGYSAPASVVAAWMGSSGHRSILMHEQLREIGVGYVTGGYYGIYVTVDFGSQPDVLPVFIDDGAGEADSRQVTLTLTNENVSGWGGIDLAEEVMISNDPGLGDSHWEPYGGEKPWMLSACGGQKTVYVKYRDASGYQVLSTDHIVYNETPSYDLQMSTQSLTFAYEIGQGFGGATTGSVLVENAASCAPMSWQGEPTGGAAWVEVIPGSGETPAQFRISVDRFQTDTPGPHTTVVTVTSPEDPASPERVAVTILAKEESAHYQMMVPLVVHRRH